MKTWNEILTDEYQKPYMGTLKHFVESETKSNKTIYPPLHEIFSAFDLTSLNDVKVVIIGQDPYINPGQAHGLAFSVREGQEVPPSLQNIYKELEIPNCKNGNLKYWAVQGVLLLNTVLTVEHGKPKSHYGKGWEHFTDRVIEILNQEKQHLVFMLWGSEAQKKAYLIDEKKHLVLKAPHPSPLSAHRGFLGCKHFNIANLFLLSTGQKQINWTVVNHV